MRQTLRRRGYSLMEILLALALAVILLGSLYVAVQTQFELATTGRNLVERTTLARAVFSRMNTDISAATTIVDPGRYRRDVNQSTGTAYSSQAEPAATTTTTTPGTTTTTPATGTGTGTGTTPTTTTTPATTTTTTPATGTESTTTTASANVTLSAPVRLPIGVVGDGTTLNLMIVRHPKETWRMPATNRKSETEIAVRQEDGTQLVTDLRVVSYWLAGADGTTPLGLARYERKIVTTDDAVSMSAPDSEAPERFVIAPEVKGLTFEYFDGSAWTSSWDSNTPGEDGKTPMGPPRAIRITLEIDFSETKVGVPGDEVQLKTFRQVVAISTANGAPQIMLEDPENVPATEEAPATGTTGTTGTTPATGTGTTGTTGSGTTGGTGR